MNRSLAARIFVNEEEENENKDTNGNETKKKSKKKKELSGEIFKDERFAKLFENKVLTLIIGILLDRLMNYADGFLLLLLLIGLCCVYDLCAGL